MYNFQKYNDLSRILPLGGIKDMLWEYNISDYEKKIYDQCS